MKAKAQNCLNNKTGVFVCWVDINEYHKRIEKAYGKYASEGLLKEFDDKINRIKYVMRRHHYYKDFNYPTCFKNTMIKHDQEYAELMKFFVERHYDKLLKAGYKPERGDGVGFCFGSNDKPFLMYGVGNLYYERKK